jgi:thymidine kinase
MNSTDLVNQRTVSDALVTAFGKYMNLAIGKTQRGRIKLYIGPMFASKSTTMLRDLERYVRAGRRCIVIKYAEDTRYDHLSKTGGIVCHDGIEYKLPVVSRYQLGDFDINDYDVIGISEAQFFPDLIECNNWANAGKIIIAEGLDGTFERKIFKPICDIIPYCEKITKLDSVCNCGNKAAFSKKIHGDMNVTVDIGGSDKYLPVCRQCY